VRKKDLLGVIEDHAGRVIDSNHHLVLSLTWLNSPQPEFVLPEITGYVLNHTPHARSFAGTKSTPVTSTNTSISPHGLTAELRRLPKTLQ